MPYRADVTEPDPNPSIIFKYLSKPGLHPLIQIDRKHYIYVTHCYCFYFYVINNRLSWLSYSCIRAITKLLLMQTKHLLLIFHV